MREEILTYVTALAGAGNETTARLIGWLVALLASANRDGNRWSEPDRFDLRRRNGQPRTFGPGTRYCLGASPARLEG